MYKEAAIVEQFGGGKVGMKVYVDVDRELSKDERNEIESFCLMMVEKVGINTHLADPSVIKDHNIDVDSLISLFPQPIYIKRIQNEYSPYGSNCLLVTTTKGVIKIGWRKRVINIDWMGSDVVLDANELFPDEQVTKQGKTIHASGYDKAKEYINTILS